MNKISIGIFGGTFNPPHNGHILTAAQLRTLVDKLYIVPTYNPEYKKCIDAEHRLRMCHLAFKDLDVHVSNADIFHRFQYTYQTINLFHSIIDSDLTQLILFVGGDWNIKKFKNYKQISKQCKIVTFSRPGYRSKVNDSFNVQLKISSSDIRDNIKKKLPVNGLVPQNVLEYIEKHGLY